MLPYVVGGVVGIGSSLLAWWAVAFLLRPRFEVGAEICFRPDEVDYRVKVLNRHRRRSLADVQVAARLEILGLREDYRDNWLTAIIPLMVTNQPFPMLRPRGSRIWTLKVEDLRFSERNRALVAERLPGGGTPPAKLEDYLNLGRDARVALAFAARHERSGVTRSVLCDFRKRDIVPGRFATDSTRVVRWPPSPVAPPGRAS